jgi:hypothetical protein
MILSTIDDPERTHMSDVNSKQVSEEKVNFAAALLGLIYTSVKRFARDFYGSRWGYLYWTSVVTTWIVLFGVASLLTILSPTLILDLLAHRGTVVLIGVVAVVLMQVLLADNERLRRWTEQGKQSHELLDRFGSQIAHAIILFALFLGPILAILRIKGVSVWSG